MPAKRRTKLVAGICGFLAILGFGTPLLYWLSGDLALKRQFAKLEAAGEPTDFAETLPEPLDPGVDYFVDLPVLATHVDFGVDPESGEPVFRDAQLQHRLQSVNVTDLAPDSLRLPNAFIPASADEQQMKRAFGENWEKLSAFDDRILPLIDAANRPAGHLSRVGPKDNPLELLYPHYTVWIAVSRVSCYRALSRLFEEDSPQAFRELSVALRLADSTIEERDFLGLMVALTIRSMVLGIIWEGLLRQAWQPAELQALDGELNQWRVREKAADALARDALALNVAVDRAFLRGGRISVVPRQFLGHNKANSLWVMHEYLVTPLRSGDWAKIQALESFLRGKSAYNMNWLLARINAPVSGKVLRRVAQIDVAKTQMQIAFVLEMWKAKHGNYPPDLSTLVPGQFAAIPVDVMSGKSMEYALDADRYRLVSVGWNLKPDGGTVAHKPGKKAPTHDAKNGDWVWHYPKKLKP